jgi:GT2 family glycosyltransferase
VRRVPRLLVVVVTYNSADVVDGCLASLTATIERDEIDARIVVSDSDSSDASRVIAQQHGAQVLPGPNRGFGAANNRAIRVAGDEVDYVLLANPDTRIVGGTLTELLAVAERETGAGVLAVAQVDEFGRRHHTLRREQRWWHAYLWNTRSRRLSVAYRDEAFYRRPQVVDWAEGSFLLLRKSVLEEVGLFDERFPLYSEEKDLCRRVRLAGYTVHYVPDIVVEHRIGERTHNQVLFLLLLQSHVQYAAKWEGPVFALLVRLAFVLRWVLPGYLPNRDPERRAVARGIVRMAMGFERARLPD